VQLKFYGLYKQVTEGKCNISEPGFFDFAAKAKWAAWNSLGSLEKEDASQQYIYLLDSVAPNWRSGEGPEGQTRKESWVVMSRPHDEEDAIEDTEKTICDWAEDGNTEKVKALITANPQLMEWKDEEGRTALHFAVDRHREDIVKFLVSCGANVNAAEQDGSTPLHYACVCENENLIEFLIKHGADHTLLNEDGQSAASIAPAMVAKWLN